MSWWRWIWLDLLSVVKDRAIALTLFGGISFYAILYPSPYLNNVPTAQALVVVDLDHSALSRQMIRHADANPGISVKGYAASTDEARQWLIDGRASSMLVIPEDFRHKLLRGKQVTLGYGGDASYFLIYSAVVQGLTQAGLDIGHQVQLRGLLAQGTNPTKAEKSLDAISLNAVSVFNKGLGYPAYVIPGLFLLILHQTLLIGTGILGAGQWRQHGYWHQLSPLAIVLCRIGTFTLLYCFFSAFYIGWCYYLYGVGLLASLGQVLLLMLPFLLATACCGVAFSTLFNRRDLPTQVLLLSSMPILFVSGFVWPLTLIPQPLVWLSQLVPAVPGIMGMLQLNQLGADWSQLLPRWLQLWGLLALYLPLAWWGVHRRCKQLALTAA
ncbi:ABC transporter permease [Shewanella dokdonensis]|uniref:ABC transporter permease n=1 Tax=Shewanella dokdonensis TaxID=712036 RepID=A0ABX8DDP1_9GAMM|nr:ABC transporter permease [Shewanella dokdonensis]MCL1075338.1 ABC transporter permease [Shewanella dokdonensis]QVK22047.1 ABC transporter permease [Shewanella dokdonensis]